MSTFSKPQPLQILRGRAMYLHEFRGKRLPTRTTPVQIDVLLQVGVHIFEHQVQHGLAILLHMFHAQQPGHPYIIHSQLRQQLILEDIVNVFDVSKNYMTTSKFFISKAKITTTPNHIPKCLTTATRF